MTITDGQESSMKGDSRGQTELLAIRDRHRNRCLDPVPAKAQPPASPSSPWPLCLAVKLARDGFPGLLEHRARQKGPDPPHPHDDPGRDQLTNGTSSQYAHKPSELTDILDLETSNITIRSNWLHR